MTSSGYFSAKSVRTTAPCQVGALVSTPSKILRAKPRNGSNSANGTKSAWASIFFSCRFVEADLRALAHQLEIIGRPLAVLHRLEDHAVRRRSERDAHQLALEVGQLVVGRVLVHDEAVAGAIDVIDGNGDQLAFALRIALEREAVH